MSKDNKIIDLTMSEDPTTEKTAEISKKKTKTVLRLKIFSQVTNLKKCYGCNKNFSKIYKKEPKDMVLQLFCKRKYVKDGKERTSKNLQAAYFHMNLNCIRKIEPDIETDVILVHHEVRKLLTAKHVELARKFGINL